MGTARPAPTTYGGSSVSSSAGASTDTWWPSPISASARSRTCAWTPPGMSQEYGQTRPTRTGSAARRGGGQVGQPEPLQHVPVLRADRDVLRERVRELLGGRPDPVPQPAAPSD